MTSVYNFPRFGPWELMVRTANRQTRSISGLVISCPVATHQHLAWVTNPLRAPQVTGGGGSLFFFFMVSHLAEVFLWVLSMAVTGLMHQKGSHLGHCSCSGKTHAYP
jgi:hypothetical protein